MYREIPYRGKVKIATNARIEQSENKDRYNIRNNHAEFYIKTGIIKKYTFDNVREADTIHREQTLQKHNVTAIHEGLLTNGL